MTPFARIDYDTACIEAATPYEDERRRHEAALDTMGEVREELNLELQRDLIDTSTNGF